MKQKIDFWLTAVAAAAAAWALLYILAESIPVAQLRAWAATATIIIPLAAAAAWQVRARLAAEHDAGRAAAARDTVSTATRIAGARQRFQAAAPGIDLPPPAGVFKTITEKSDETIDM
jgi:hypothetical protein